MQEKKLFLSLSIFFLLFLTLSSCSPILRPEANSRLNGRFHLPSGEILSLEGDWKFIPKELVPPDSPLWQSQYQRMKVPGIWNAGAQPILPDRSLATYQAKVVLPAPGPGPFALFLGDINTAYRVYIEEKLVFEQGSVHENLHLVQGHIKPSVVPFFGEGEVRVTLQVANRQDNMGGVKNKILIGEFQKIQSYSQGRWAWDAFFAGGFLILGLLHFIQYKMNPQFKKNLYLGLLSLVIALRTLLIGQRILASWFGWMGFDFLIKIEFLTIFPTAILLVFLLRSIYFELWKKNKLFAWLLYPVVGMSILYFFLNIILPTYYLGLVFFVYDFVLLVLLLSFLSLVITAALRREKGAFLMVLGILAITITVVNDVLYVRNILSTGFIFTAGLMVFMLVQSVNISFQTSLAFKGSERINKELYRLNQMKARFWEKTAHDVRTPLHGIIGLSDHLLDSCQEAKGQQKYHLFLIRNTAKRLEELTQSMMDKGQGAKSQEGKEESFELLASLELILAGVMSTEQKRKASLVFSRSPKPLYVKGSVSGFEKVAFNLLDYALGDMDLGEIKVEFLQQSMGFQVFFRRREENKPSQSWDLWFDSQGKDLRKEFSRESEKWGFSLELKSLSKSEYLATFVFHHSGDPSSDLQIQSLSSLEEQGKRAELPIETKRDSPLVLMVDDEPTNLLVLENFLSSKQYRILKAINGEQALDILNREKPDLVLLDVMMPGLSGYETCRQIRKGYSDLELPIILLTAKNRIQDLVAGFSAGANDFISKPFNRLELGARLEAQVKIARLTQIYSKFRPKGFLSLLGKDTRDSIGAGEFRALDLSLLYLRLYPCSQDGHEPEEKEKFKTLVACFTSIIPILHSHGGFVHQYQGEGFYALFPQEEKGALGAAMAIFDLFRPSPSVPTLIRLNMSLHKGHALLGTVGLEDELKDTMLSDLSHRVNLIKNAVDPKSNVLYFSKDFLPLVENSGYTPKQEKDIHREEKDGEIFSLRFDH